MAGLDPDAWQAEADLLAEGRELLEKLCSTTRYAHLFPDGPNVALLLEAYQELDRHRVVHREARDSLDQHGLRDFQLRRDRRRLRRLLRRMVRKDALARNRRLHWHYPLPRPRHLGAKPPPVVREALAKVDPDVREEVQALIHGDPGTATDPERSYFSPSRVEARAERGLDQFREAFINAALAHPSRIAALHPQYISFAVAPQPTRARHPIATLLLVKLPLRLMMILIIIFNVAYLGAYNFFNDEVLGNFLTERIGSILGGELHFGSCHWRASAIVDLSIGRAHKVYCEDVVVYDNFKNTDEPKGAYSIKVERLDGEIYLHEIIPWNKTGLVPKTLEIPWVLHLRNVKSTGEVVADIHSSQPAGREGEWFVNLVHSFEFSHFVQKPGYKTLGFQIEDAHLDDVQFRLGFEENGGWGTELTMKTVDFELHHDGHFPEDPKPITPPFRFHVLARAADGIVNIPGLFDESLPLTGAEELELSSGMAGTILGDMRVRGSGMLGDSPAQFDGFLRDMFQDEIGVSYRLATTDAGGLVARFFAPDEPDQRPLAQAAGAPVAIEIEGRLRDPTIQIAGQGLTLDFVQSEPAWALDDVDLSIQLARDPVPQVWASHYNEADEAGQIPDSEIPQRWIIYLDTFRGAALDGGVRLHGRGVRDHVVLPQGKDERLLTSVYLDLLGVNPGRLFANDPRTERMLAGSARGGVQLHELVVDGKSGVRRAELQVHDVRLERDRGPSDDRLPRRLWADGEVVYDADAGIDLRALKLSTDGGHLRVSGGVDAKFEQLDPGSLVVRVDDGPAFMRAFGLDPYFQRLLLDFGFSGPVARPNGKGKLSVDGTGTDRLGFGGLGDARIWMDSGVLHVRSPAARLLGGRGPLEVDMALFEGGKLTKDPRIRVYLDLDGVDGKQLLGTPVDAEGAALRIHVDDGNDGLVRLSEFQARGAAYAKLVRYEGVEFREADVAFALTRESLRIDRMNVSYHRQISPSIAREVTVPVGGIHARGTVGFGSDPALDLEVEANGLPLRIIGEVLDRELPLQGQLAQGTRVKVEGTLRQPKVEGDIALDSMGAAGIPLGHGRLKLSSRDLPASRDVDGGLRPAHRELRISGRLNERAAEGEDPLDWRVDALIAFGQGQRRGRSQKPEYPIEADLHVDFTSLPMHNLLRHPSRARWAEDVEGGIDELDIRAQYCPEDAPMLDGCARAHRDRSGEAERLHVGLEMGKFWYRARGGAKNPDDKEAAGTKKPDRKDVCDDPTAMCSTNALVATLDGSMLELSTPFRLRTGGAKPVELQLSGKLDLSSEPKRPTPTPAGSPPDRKQCQAGRPALPLPVVGGSEVQVEGELDLAALEALLRPFEIQSPGGQVVVDLKVTGRASNPAVAGAIDLPADRKSIELRFGEQQYDRRGRRKPSQIPIEISSLTVALRGGTISAAGDAKIVDETIRFGSVSGKKTFFELSGPCAGSYAVAAEGTLDGAIPSRIVPNLFTGSGGAVDLRDFYIWGTTSALSNPDEPLFEEVGAKLVFGRKTTRLETDFETVNLTSGQAEIRSCTSRRPCGRRVTSGAAAFVGRELAAASPSAPSSAIKAKVGGDGDATLWGAVYLPPRFDGVAGAQVRAAMNRIPLTVDDNAGRPELVAELSSPEVELTADETGALRVRGRIVAEKSRWLRDAVQGFEVVSFEDPVPDTPKALPDIVADTELDLQVQTGQPFRMDNNVLKQFEATAELEVHGTVRYPEVTGSIAVERGVIDIDILGGAFDIERGRVSLDRELSRSKVDLSAVRQDPIKIDGQLRTLTLYLSGALDAIEWECHALGATNSTLGTVRGCIDYVIFDAGNVDVTDDSVRQVGTNLIGSRFLPVAGRLTQIRLNDRLAKENPRLEGFVPETTFRADQLGFVTEIKTKPEWGDLGWGGFNIGFDYLRGYPGSVLRDSRSFSAELEILDNMAIEARTGQRNYSNRVLVLDPPNYRSLQFRVQRLKVPSVR